METLMGSGNAWAIGPAATSAINADAASIVFRNMQTDSVSFISVLLLREMIGAA